MKFIFCRQIFVFVLLPLFCFSVFAQTERDQGIELYKSKNYDGAITTLKKAIKTNSADATNWYFLGLSYLGKNKLKDSIGSLKKAIEIKPDDAQMRIGLAYAYLRKNDNNSASKEALKSLELDPKRADAHYILANINFRDEMYNSAYERVNKAIQLDPNFAAAYLLKSEALVSSFAQQSGTIIKPPASRNATLLEASENLEKYLSLTPASNNDVKFYREYLESLKFFAEYYKSSENQLPKSLDAQPAAGETPLNIISKPHPEYTDQARQAQITGIVRLLVGFSADGKVKHILIIKALSHGLSEAAVSAAREIKFKPEMKNGAPVSVVKTIEYSFSIY